MKLHAHLIILPALLFAAPALAEGKFSIGAQLGRADLSAAFEGYDLDASESSARIYAAWAVNQHLAIEGGYQTFGDFEQDFGSETVSVKADGFTLALEGRLPVSHRFTVTGRGGAFFWDGNAGINDVTSATPEDTNLFFAIGGRYQLTESLNLRAEWTRYDLDQATSRTLSTGLEWVF